FRFNFSRLEKLSKEYSLLAKIDGQLSGQPLIASELFMVGGAESVRGYLESSAGGDSGVHGTLELRSPNLLTGNHPWL
ncbi:ShlB/FhaC/HecB family hemolysin secretion/activation protein, partial [Acinetobacter baumannii]